MGGEQAAKTLVEVKEKQLKKQNEKIDSKVLEKVYTDTLEAYQHQMSAYYATSQIWDDGIIDPKDTRMVLGLSISAALNAPVENTKFGLFRM